MRAAQLPPTHNMMQCMAGLWCIQMFACRFCAVLFQFLGCMGLGSGFDLALDSPARSTTRFETLEFKTFKRASFVIAHMFCDCAYPMRGVRQMKPFKSLFNCLKMCLF